MDAKTYAERVASIWSKKPRRHGREFRVPCPVHEGDGGQHTPSLAIWDVPSGGFAMKCMTGCPGAAIRRELVRWGVSSPTSRRTTAEALAMRAAIEAARVEKLTRAVDLWEDSVPVADGDAVAKYLASRGLWPLPDGCRDQIMTATDSIYAGFPALLGCVVDPMTLCDEQVTLTGVALLSLMKDGTPRMDRGRKTRSIMGTQKGMGVALGVPGATMVVGEGIETTLSAMRLMSEPFGIATLSASNMPTLGIPPFVRHVIVAQDADEAGRDAAMNLLSNLVRLRSVSGDIRWWDGPKGWDANDELLKRRGSK